MRALLWLRHGEPGPGGLCDAGRLQIGRVAGLLPPAGHFPRVCVIHSGADRARATAQALLDAWQPPDAGMREDRRLWSGPDRRGNPPFLEDDPGLLPGWLEHAGDTTDLLVAVTHLELCTDLLPLLAAACGTRGPLPAGLDRGQGVFFDLADRSHRLLDGRAG